ncbi:MAG: hypothetical protein R3C32_03730 [Chloroflexota bacterium]
MSERVDASDRVVVETTWGPWPALRLEDPWLSVCVVPRVGGRVVSLLDRRTGREWLGQGEPPDAAEAGRWSAEDAVFDGRVSFGWDECAPSVVPCQDPLDPGGPPLRDPGDQWGRACEVAFADPVRGISTRWASPRWPMTLGRTLSLVGGGSLQVAYELASHADRPMPALWAAHTVLRLEPGGRVELRDVTTTRVTWVAGWPVEPGPRVPWPEPTPGFDLSRVRDADEPGAVKLHAVATRAAAVAPDGARLGIEVDGDLVRTIGVWLDAGGWPPGGPPVHQSALEPTSSPDDHVVEALEAGRAWTVPAGGVLRWQVRMDVGGSA